MKIKYIARIEVLGKDEEIPIPVYFPIPSSNISFTLMYKIINVNLIVISNN